MSKQSSVEWLAIELWEEMNMQGDGAIFNKLFEQAKAMHKEEMCQFVSDYLDDAADDMTAEEYYDQIFGGNNEQN